MNTGAGYSPVKQNCLAQIAAIVSTQRLGKQNIGVTLFVSGTRQKHGQTKWAHNAGTGADILRWRRKCCRECRRPNGSEEVDQRRSPPGMQVQNMCTHPLCLATTTEYGQLSRC